MIRDKSLQPSQSAWLESFYQSNSCTKGKRLDVSLDLTFRLILMSRFLITIGLEKVIFPYLKQAKASLKYPKEQMSLIIMDTFKGQNNNVILDLCEKHLCQVVIIPHNLTNKFQLLDITVSKLAKSFISNKYNKWFSKQV